MNVPIPHHFRDLDDDDLVVYYSDIEPDSIAREDAPSVESAIFLEATSEDDLVIVYFDEDTALRVAEAILEQVRLMKEDR